MTAPRARAVLLGLVLALGAAISPAAASLPDHGLAGGGPAAGRVLDLLRTTAQAEEAQEPAPAPGEPSRPAFNLWPEPPPPDGQLFARTPEPPLPEPAVLADWLSALDLASGDPARLPATRIRAFGLFDPISHPGSNRLSSENATGYVFGLWPTYVGPNQKGLWTDPVTGISYARARWLDTRTGAWLSEDPLGAVDSPNLYAFVAWQPSMATDPLGEQMPAPSPPPLPPPSAPGPGTWVPVLIQGGGGAAAAETAGGLTVGGGFAVAGTGLAAAGATRLVNYWSGGAVDRWATRNMRNNLLVLWGSADAINVEGPLFFGAPHMSPGVLISEGWTPVRDIHGNVVQWLPPQSDRRSLSSEEILSLGQGPLRQEAAAEEMRDQGRTTPRFFRFVTEPELRAIEETHLLRGGRPGETYFTTQEIKSATKAQERLGLPVKPTHRIEFEIINDPEIVGPRRVSPAFDQPGQGIELVTEEGVRVRVVNVQPLKP